MSPTSNDMPKADISTLLPWLVEMGADEVLLDNPVDRFVVPPVEDKPVAIEKPRATILPPPPKPAVNWQAIAAGAEGVAGAEALAARITSLDDFVGLLDGFISHPLRKTATRTAALSGNLSAKLLLLCDRARNDEDKSGDVLAGNNRVLAERMMQAIGLKIFTDDGTDSFAMANFVPWRPPGNRSLTEQEGLMLVPFARKLISLLKPSLILCMGPLPAQYLAGGEEAIMRARGKWLEVDGIPTLTTFHPDTLLKAAPSKRLSWHDLQAFRQKLDALT